jgi:hypothetical protein
MRADIAGIGSPTLRIPYFQCFGTVIAYLLLAAIPVATANVEAAAFVGWKDDGTAVAGPGWSSLVVDGVKWHHFTPFSALRRASSMSSLMASKASSVRFPSASRSLIESGFSRITHLMTLG